MRAIEYRAVALSLVALFVGAACTDKSPNAPAPGDIATNTPQRDAQVSPARDGGMPGNPTAPDAQVDDNDAGDLPDAGAADATSAEPNVGGACGEARQTLSALLQSAQHCDNSLGRLPCRGRVEDECGCATVVDQDTAPATQSYLNAAQGAGAQCEVACRRVVCRRIASARCATEGEAATGRCETTYVE